MDHWLLLQLFLASLANLVVMIVVASFVRSSVLSYAPSHVQLEELIQWDALKGNVYSQLQWKDVCSDIDLSVFDPGKACGSPLSEPCFNHTRCSSSQRSMMYVYDHACSLANSSELLDTIDEVLEERDRVSDPWRRATRDAGLLAETYESACLFLHVNERVDHEPCAHQAPLWNSGANHVMVDLTDKTREFRPHVARSLAMEAAINVRTCFYRSGYDISVPLPPKVRFPTLATVHPSDREFLLTFKGTVYIANGERGAAERTSLAPLHNPAEGVAVLMRCFEVHGTHLLPAYAPYCGHLRESYEDFSYGALMNATFGLVPAGRSPASYRLGEVMSAGAIPVFVATSTVRPFQEQIDWSAFSFVFSPDQVGPEMLAALRAIPQEELEEMQRKSLAAYRKLFGDASPRWDAIAKNVVHVLQRRLEHHRI